jgi:UDP-2,4-diacetamido-2,4,6-trideoxy-beta-L-altropyranose hydrolase
MRILIRADGDRRIGTGHVMRMLALAGRALAEGHSVALASARLDEALALRAARAGVPTTTAGVEPGSDADVSWTIREAAARAADWVVVDGYPFDAACQEVLRDAGLRVLFVDDFGHCARYAANVVLNQNISATDDLYVRRRSDTTLLLGPAYALLRPEFVHVATSRREVRGAADRILVTLGGADPRNATADVLTALAGVLDERTRVRVVVGPSNPHAEALVSIATDPRIELLRGVDDMAALMAWADLAVAAASTTVYELCCAGVPSVLVAISDHQRELGRAMDRAGLATYAGWSERLDPARLAREVSGLGGDVERRAAMSRRGRERVDGCGASRVLRAVASVAMP